MSAIITLLASAALLTLSRKEIPIVGKKFLNRFLFCLCNHDFAN